jgi:hypothetical protein
MPAEDDFSMTRSPPRRGQRAGGDSDSQRPSPSPRAELCDMILECNLALIPNIRINRRLLLWSTVVVEHGMFLGMATTVIVAHKDGNVVVMNKVGNWRACLALAGGW